MKPSPPGSKIGNPVVFAPPIAVGLSPRRKGVVIDEVWTDVLYDKEWGWYAYTAQLIEWADDSRSIRLTYYYHPEGAKNWRFGGQYSIEDKPEVIHGLIRATLKKGWR
ncbi:MAG: hypothetical protein F9K30_24385 [Dechloromonas sp.]|nr:MAG: hypothetical protein F9K30_24385 [Dechloromonas sp.]